MARLLGFGSALLDVLAHVPEEFLVTVGGLKGGTELVDGAEMQRLLARLPVAPRRAPGGSAANTVVGVAKLGMASGFLGKTGADADGELYTRSLVSAGVAVGAVKTSLSVCTGRCLSLITPDSQRTMRTFLGAAADLRPEEMVADDFAGATHFHLEGYQLFNRELFLRAVTLAKQAGCTVSLDLSAPEVVNASRDVLPRLLADYVDMVFANEDEASAFADGRGEEAGLDALSTLCPATIVKLGIRGVLIRLNGKTVHAPARVVPAVDTTGAGDLWAAGFLYGWLNGVDPVRAGEFGARVAAEVVQVTGAVIPEPTWQQLRDVCRL